MKISLIVALNHTGLIGKNGGLPWRLPADLQHFKRITMGKPVIMGRRTCESLSGPLPGRQNLVLTQNLEYKRPGFTVFTEKKRVLDAVQHVDEAVVIGGAEIYRLFMPHIEYAYVTVVEGDFTGDTWFPQWPLEGWRTVRSEKRPPDEKNFYAMSFMELEKMENI